MALFTAAEHVAAILRDAGICPDVRNSDSLDFHDLSITQIKALMADAFRAGALVGKWDAENAKRVGG
jgi:hypothetical protein